MSPSKPSTVSSSAATTSFSHHRCIGLIAGCLRIAARAFPTLCARDALDAGRQVTPASSFFSKTRTSSQSSVPSAHTAASSAAFVRVASANGSLSLSLSRHDLKPCRDTAFVPVSGADAPEAPARRNETPSDSIHRAATVASRSRASLRRASGLGAGTKRTGLRAAFGDASAAFFVPDVPGGRGERGGEGRADEGGSFSRENENELPAGGRGGRRPGFETVSGSNEADERVARLAVGLVRELSAEARTSKTRVFFSAAACAAAASLRARSAARARAAVDSSRGADAGRTAARKPRVGDGFSFA